MTRSKIESAKQFFLLVLVSLILLSGCRQDKQPAPPPSDNTDAAEQLQRLENNGTIPKLDRSDDLAGPDIDGNGVRDDIDAYIAQQKVTEPQKRAMTQMARSIQATLLVDIKDKKALNRAGHNLADAVNCMGRRFRNSSEHKSYFTIKKLSQLTANTRARVVQYSQYNTARSGSVTRLPDGDTCDE